MRRWWEELVIDFRDRMGALVYLAHQGGLDKEEHEEAVRRALERFGLRLMHTFEGTSMGELVNACKTMATYAYRDVQRDSVARRARETVPLDADAPAPSWDASEARRRYEADETAREIDGFLAWALPQLNDNRR